MQRKFSTYCLLFFIPVLVVYGIVEYFTLKIPSSFAVNKERIANENEEIQTLVLGSSQLMNAINPEWLSTPTLNVASGDQHHDTDFKLYQGLQVKLPKLNSVVLEVSYSHFELPHNGKDFWKNNLYYHYYQINCFERTAYFKDGLVYISNTQFFSKMVNEYYIQKSKIPEINAFGFNKADGYQQFAKFDFDKKRIDAMRSFKININPNRKVFKENTQLFFEMLDTLQAHQKQVVICSPPMYASFVKMRNPEILHRRDSIFEEIQKKYPNILFLKAEEDTLQYTLPYFWNQSHLNPKGANLFSIQLDSVLQKLN